MHDEDPITYIDKIQLYNIYSFYPNVFDAIVEKGIKIIVVKT